MKHFLSLCRHDVGRTLALTVGSPSAHRRGTMLKHFAFMLLLLLSSLNVWGTEVEVISTLNLSATTQVSSQIEIVEDVLFMSGDKNNANQAPTLITTRLTEPTLDYTDWLKIKVRDTQLLLF